MIEWGTETGTIQLELWSWVFFSVIDSPWVLYNTIFKWKNFPLVFVTFRGPTQICCFLHFFQWKRWFFDEVGAQLQIKFKRSVFKIFEFCSSFEVLKTEIQVKCEMHKTVLHPASVWRREVFISGRTQKTKITVIMFLFNVFIPFCSLSHLSVMTISYLIMELWNAFLYLVY